MFFLVPCEKYFYLSFVFGDKAVAAVEQSDIPQSMIDELKNAKKYTEGRGLRVEVKKKNDIKNVLKLVEIKMKN